MEADVSQLNARVANVEVDVRELRASMDRRLEIMDAKLDQVEVLTTTMAEGFEAIDAGLEKMTPNSRTGSTFPGSGASRS